MKKLPKLKSRVSQHGFPALVTIDPGFVPEELILLIPYAEIMAFDWVKKGFENFLANAPDGLFKDLKQICIILKAGSTKRHGFLKGSRLIIMHRIISSGALLVARLQKSTVS